LYNRYLRNDLGNYTRITPAEYYEPPKESPHTPPSFDRLSSPKEKGGKLFSSLLKTLHLQEINRADLMLLALLFFLFEEDADEELLIALGLLLIL